MSEEETGELAVYHCHDSGCLRHYHHQISLQRDRQIPCLGRHYRQGGAGYTWLDAALDVVGEHDYTILSDVGDGDGPAAILIDGERLDLVRQLIHQQHALGKMVDGATEVGLARIDDVRTTVAEALADVFEQLLLEAGLVESLVVSRGS
jgi:hypothetical protein